MKEPGLSNIHNCAKLHLNHIAEPGDLVIIGAEVICSHVYVLQCV